LVEIIAHVEAQVADFRPDAVYVHFGGDVNHDHRQLFRAAQVALRPYAAPGVKEFLAFETPSSTEWGARPSKAASPRDFRRHHDHAGGEDRGVSRL
jgi:LmbE family N-acetylglucosaminyl deacetylase